MKKIPQCFKKIYFSIPRQNFEHFWQRPLKISFIFFWFHDPTRSTPMLSSCNARRNGSYDSFLTKCQPRLRWWKCIYNILSSCSLCLVRRQLRTPIYLPQPRTIHNEKYSLEYDKISPSHDSSEIKNCNFYEIFTRIFT